MKEKFRKLINALGFKTDTAFAEAIEVKRTRLSSFLNGQTKYPTLEILISIKKKFPEVNLNALVGFDGPLIFSPEEMQEQEALAEAEAPQSWQRYVEQLEKENEHLREQNKQFMQLLQEQRDKP